MYAVIETGGKQFRVQPGDLIDVELLADAGNRGSAIEFDRVLMVAGDSEVQIGTPLIDGARVKGVLLNRVRGPKIRVFKMKRRKQYRRTRGHRQDYLRVRIEGIEA